MTLRRLLCALLVLAPTLTRAAPPVRITVGHTLGLYRFVESITDGPQASKQLASAFRGSRFDTPRARELAAAYRAIRDAHCGRGYFFEGYPRQRREMGFDVRQAFNLQSALARDLADLAGRTAQLLPPVEHRRLLEILRSFGPAYDALIWRPSRAKLERYRRRLAALAHRAGVRKMFDRAARFYGSAWPDGLPLTVVLHPVPGARGHTTAYVIAHVAPMEALLDEKDLAGRFGVLFHELCHALYESQPARRQAELERWFAADASPYAALAHGLLNEGLATALGNGWAREQATGELDPDPWYSDPQIDGFARALHPLVVDYLARGRSMDRELVTETVARYRARFPDAPRVFDNLLKEVFLATDEQVVGIGEAGRALRRRFRVPSMTRSSPLGHADTAKTLGEVNSRASAILIFSPAQQAQLERFARRVPAIGAWLPDLRKRRGSWVFSGLDRDQRLWIVIRIRRGQDLERALAALQRAGRVDPKRPFLEL